MQVVFFDELGNGAAGHGDFFCKSKINTVNSYQLSVGSEMIGKIIRIEFFNLSVTGSELNFTFAGMNKFLFSLLIFL